MKEQTAIWQAIKKLEETPTEMNSNKAIAGWLQACYLDLEREQIEKAYNDGWVSNVHESSEQYFTTTYKQP